MLWALQCTYIASSCMSLIRGCKPDLLPDIFNLSIIWNSANHWYGWQRCFRTIGLGERGGKVLLQRRTAFYRSAQLSIAFALFQYVSILRGCCTPNLIFGGARWRQWVTVSSSRLSSSGKQHKCKRASQLNEAQSFFHLPFPPTANPFWFAKSVENFSQCPQNYLRPNDIDPPDDN